MILLGALGLYVVLAQPQKKSTSLLLLGLLGLLGLYFVRRTATLDSLTSRAAAFWAQIRTQRSAFPVALPKPPVAGVVQGQSAEEPRTS